MTLLPSSAMNVDRFEKGPREILNPEIQKVPTHTCQSTSHCLHIYVALIPYFAFVEMCAANQRPLSAAFRYLNACSVMF